jgi:hypothetical protein
MADGPGLETYANHTNSSPAGSPAETPLRPPRSAQDVALGRALVFIGIAAASAGLAYVIVRTSLKAPLPADPTTERIQQLIDEANRLLKALDEKKPD